MLGVGWGRVVAGESGGRGREGGGTVAGIFYRVMAESVRSACGQVLDLMFFARCC